jgi:predicted oxidoreductase
VRRICQQRKKYSWHILNWRIAAKELALSGAEHNEAIRDKKHFTLLKNALFGNNALVRRMVDECPDFITANSVPELARKMNKLVGTDDVDVKAMEHDIKLYDDQIERGVKFHNDDQLRRIANSRNWPSDRMRTCKFQKIVDPKAMPLIAIRYRVMTRKCLGGIRTDLQSRVVDQSGEPIPGLYAAGEAAGFGGGGCNGKSSLEGTFISSCILSGRIAARSVAGVPNP